ncbi:interleukin-1 beta [Macrotis lagotis]|uniref:interleukin-1 beta n=1 Tax=Macrotis lagotis TaxID=92651 RepID=UPI003D69B677
MAAEESFFCLTAETDCRPLALLLTKEYRVMAMGTETPYDKMEYYRENDDSQCYKIDGPNQRKGFFQDTSLSSSENLLEENKIQVKFIDQPHRFHQTVVVIISIERMKHLSESCSKIFKDCDLINIITSIFQEELVSFGKCDPYESDFAFLSSHNCTIQDINQKHLALTSASELQALYLNGRNINQQVIFSMRHYVNEIGSRKTYVVLGIKKNNLYLSCGVREGIPILQLEQMDSFPRNNVEERFIFNKREINQKIEFESVKYPNWYISTSQSNGKPVFLGNTRGGTEITTFTLHEL